MRKTDGRGYYFSKKKEGEPKGWIVDNKNLIKPTKIIDILLAFW